MNTFYRIMGLKKESSSYFSVNKRPQWEFFKKAISIVLCTYGKNVLNKRDAYYEVIITWKIWNFTYQFYVPSHFTLTTIYEVTVIIFPIL